jgi:hypothetical protein
MASHSVRQSTIATQFVCHHPDTAALESAAVRGCGCITNLCRLLYEHVSTCGYSTDNTLVASWLSTLKVEMCNNPIVLVLACQHILVTAQAQAHSLGVPTAAKSSLRTLSWADCRLALAESVADCSTHQ